MSIHHHPSDALLLDYASGNTGPAAELAVASHLTFCPHCRRTNQLLDSIGGHLIAEIADPPPVSVTPEKIMTHVRALSLPSSPPTPKNTILPAPLRHILGGDVEGLHWKRLGMGAFHYVIPIEDPNAKARLLRIPAGRPVPVHTHRGTELTLVLSGAFSDATGVFVRGDLQEADDSLVHQPHAAAGEDCICLAVTEGPLRFKSWPARLVQPFLGI